eukprot:gene11406-15254_t
MALVDATPDDIPAIMAIERDPAYELFIGNFEAEEHAARMASTNDRYLVWREEGAVLAFAILSKLDEPHGVVLLKRIGWPPDRETAMAQDMSFLDDYLVRPDPQAARLGATVSGIDQTGATVETRVVTERALPLYLNAQEIVPLMTIGDHPDALTLGDLLNQN